MSMDSEESRTLVKTTVFVLSHTPYKATLRLPRLSRFPKEMVAEAAAQQGCKKLVALPHGHFEVLFNNRDKNYQVAVSMFRNVVGCRSTQSAQHGHLPRNSIHLGNREDTGGVPVPLRVRAQLQN